MIFLPSMRGFGSSLNLGKKCLVERQGSVRVVFRPSLTTLNFRGIG